MPRACPWVAKALLRREGIAIYKNDRGGDVTYHGPGQLVIYPIIDIRNFSEDIGAYVWSLEEIVIKVLKEYGIQSGRKSGYRGVWVGSDKIAAIGLKIKKWVSMHGMAFNVSTNMDYFKSINPCGLAKLGFGVTSLKELLDEDISFLEIVSLYIKYFKNVFGCEIDLFNLPDNFTYKDCLKILNGSAP